jgi:hypothetical protein
MDKIAEETMSWMYPRGASTPTPEIAGHIKEKDKIFGKNIQTVNDWRRVNGFTPYGSHIMSEKDLEQI